MRAKLRANEVEKDWGEWQRQSRQWVDVGISLGLSECVVECCSDEVKVVGEYDQD